MFIKSIKNSKSLTITTEHENYSSLRNFFLLQLTGLQQLTKFHLENSFELHQVIHYTNYFAPLSLTHLTLLLSSNTIQYLITLI
jgi:hypothetical protein